MSPSDPPVAAPTPHQTTWKSGDKCPRCDSPKPHLHPAMQFEGEVQECSDPFHLMPTNQNRVAAPTPNNSEAPRRYVQDALEGRPVGTVVGNSYRVAAPTPYFTPEEPPQNCDAKLWRLICLRVHALHEENERLRARVAATTPPDVTKEEFVRQVKDEALRLQRAYKLSSAATLQEAFHRFEPFRVPERAAPTPETPSKLRELLARMRSDAARFKVQYGGLDVIYANTVDDWADELEQALAGAVSHPQPEVKTNEIVIVGTCRNDAPHYCPNCDNSFTALRVANPVVSPRTET